MKTKEISTKNQAMAWWDTLPVFGIPSKEYYMGLYYSDDDVTPERIEEIWIKETQTIRDESPREFLKNNPKPNQKQSPADEIIELVGEDNFKQIIKESDKRVNQKQYPEETFGLASEITREQALAWWTDLQFGKKCFFRTKYHPQERQLSSLTGREIEEIWRKETGGELATGGEKVLEILNSKPNQKQFKEPNPLDYNDVQEYRNDLKKYNQKEFKQFNESLHKAYLNKFSEEDKFKAFISNLNELSKEVQFNAFLTTLKKMNLDSQTQSNIMTLVALRDI